jgi:hypothetical protein
MRNESFAFWGLIMLGFWLALAVYPLHINGLVAIPLAFVGMTFFAFGMGCLVRFDYSQTLLNFFDGLAMWRYDRAYDACAATVPAKEEKAEMMAQR